MAGILSTIDKMPDGSNNHLLRSIEQKPERRDDNNHVGFALWLMLDQNSDNKLTAFYYATRLYFHFVSETPHITLVSSIMHYEDDTLKRTEKLAEQLKPIPITFKELVWSEDRKSFHISIEPVGPIMNARKLGCSMFDNYKSKPHRYPHLTIGHGDISIVEKAELETMYSNLNREIHAIPNRIKANRLEIHAPTTPDSYGNWKQVGPDFLLKNPPRKSKLVSIA